MRVEVKKDTIKPIEYPCLMINQDDVIVLFRNRSKGTIVSSDNFQIGSFFADWDMNDFKPFNGEITLSNK